MMEHAPEQPALFLEFIVTIEMLGVLLANLCLRALENKGVCGFRGFAVVAGVYLCDAITAEHGCESSFGGRHLQVYVRGDRGGGIGRLFGR